MTATVLRATEGRREAQRAPFILPLDRPAPPADVGGKAHHLQRAVGLGVRVPEGVVVTTRALDDHLAHHGISTASGAGALREAIVASPLPPRLRDALHLATRAQLASGPVVVRSSAVDEDSADRSFAGQHDSFLHITHPRALEEAVRRCWASCWSDRALAYRAHGTVPPARPAIAVVVQRQVRARAAGVLFTRAGDDHTMLVEWTPGLGDRLVGGAVTPGRFTIDLRSKAAHRIEDPRHSDREAERVVFDAGTIDQLIRVASRLQCGFGTPQDVEWAVDARGEVYVVQSRPITAALPSLATLRRVPQVTWSNANINENFPSPISPLLYSIMSVGYASYFRNLARAFGLSRRRVAAIDDALGHIVGVHGGRPYYNLSNVHTVLRAAPFGGALVAAFNRFVGTSGVEGRELEAGGTESRVTAVAEVARMLAQTAWTYRALGRRVRDFETLADDFAARTTLDALRRASLHELRLLLAEFMAIRRDRWTNAALADAAAMVTYAALHRLVQRSAGADGGGALHNTLLTAMPDLASAQPVQRLWDLSRLVRDDAGLRSLFANENARIVRSLRADPRFAAFRVALDQYLERYGFRCSAELMLTVPGYQEQPEALIETIKAYVRADGESPARMLERQVAERDRVLHELTRRQRGRRLSPWLPFLTHARALRIVTRWTQNAIAYRERARFKQALLYSRCRALSRELGARLAAAGHLDHGDDVFWLTAPELDELAAGTAMFPRHVPELVALRKRAHAHLSSTRPPDVLSLPEGGYLPEDAGAAARPGARSPQGRLWGTSACTGRATGRAVVLEDVKDVGRLRTGDILVTRQTDPGWAPVFFLIAGLVVERGGMLSHGAIVAREFAIPCVVAIEGATEIIRDGCSVTVDGDAGSVDVHD